MSSLLRVRPTKIELIRLKRRKELAKKVHRILRERLTILVNELLTRVREAYHLRREVNRLVLPVYNNAVFLSSIYGDKIYGYLKGTTVKEPTVIVGRENIMGVKSLSALIKKGEVTKFVYPSIDEFRKQSYELISTIIKLGRAEQAIIALGDEINRTKRKVNALEYIIIPRLENTIRYLRMKFEEREREEKARLKRVKEMLEKKAQGKR